MGSILCDTPSTAGTFRKKFQKDSRKMPERARKRSQSFSWNSPREYGWDRPDPIIHGIWRLQSISRIISPQYSWGRFFFQKWFRRGPLRAGHGIPSSTGGISESHIQPTHVRSASWSFCTFPAQTEGAMPGRRICLCTLSQASFTKQSAGPTGQVTRVW